MGLFYNGLLCIDGHRLGHPSPPRLKTLHKVPNILITSTRMSAIIRRPIPPLTLDHDIALKNALLTTLSPSPLISSPSPTNLHDGFLSPAPAFHIDALSIHLAPPSRPPSPPALSFASILDFGDDSDIFPNTYLTLDVISNSAAAKEGEKPTTSDNAPPQRPPARPHHLVQSKFDLEPNPFEQSFSKSSHHSNSSRSERERTTPPRGGDATSIKHNALPPLSSLTSPAAADPSQFPWLASQSLRTGPLSPAMLAGPQSQNGHGHAGKTAPQDNNQHQEGGAFDSSTFRTGFTPGTGSGFTPGYSSLMGGNFASSLPMPSPNTAAFLNMVTNSTGLENGSQQSAQQNQENGNGTHHNAGEPSHAHHPPSAIPPHMQHQSSHGLSHLQPNPNMPQDTITPGTLSALTGVLNDMSRTNGQPNGPPPPPGSHVHPQYYQQQGVPPHAGMPGQGHPGVPNVDYAQQSANAASQAANGLFLLSQAHQELSKREEAETRGTPAPGGKRASSGSNGVPTQTRNVSGNPPPVAGAKRKSDAPPPAAKGGKKGKKTNAEKKAEEDAMMLADMDSVSPNFSMDTGDEEDRKPGGSKFETEEEKRKNFLERNRQGEQIAPGMTTLLEKSLLTTT